MKIIEKYLVLLVSVIIFVVALFYPAWGSNILYPLKDYGRYGFEILLSGFMGIFLAYVPWYFLFPAISIVSKITKGVPSKMLLSRILLFLFWLEGFIAVVFFHYGGQENEAENIVITQIGPSFWMWTILVWYVLLCAFFYVQIDREKSIIFLKRTSSFALICVALLASNYHYQNFKINELSYPLEQAMKNSDLSAIENLIQKGAMLNEKWKPIIITATRLGADPSVINLLIQKGAATNARDFQGQTALEMINATDMNKQVETARILLNNGADKMAINRALVKYSISGNLVLIKILAESGVYGTRIPILEQINIDPVSLKPEVVKILEKAGAVK